MEQLHTTRFSSRVLRSLLGLSVCALVAAGCVAVPTGQTVPLASATSPPTMAELDQINKINSALAAAGPTNSILDGRLPLSPRRPAGDHTL